MLSLLRDQVGIYLGLAKCAIVRVKRSIGKKVIDEKLIQVESGSSLDWESALKALEDELAAGTWGQSDLSVVLADNWLHYDLLPWSAELTTEDEQTQHARHVMASTYGDLVDDWTISLSSISPGRNRVICAVPSALLEQLQALAELCDGRVISIQPQLIASFNRWRHRLPRSSAWFATVDDGSLAALHIADGRCDRVRSVRLGSDWAVELSRIQTIGRLAKSRAADGAMYVDVPARWKEIADVDGSDIHWLEGARSGRGALARLSAIVEKTA